MRRWMPDDVDVIRGRRIADTFKAHFPFNDMVEDLTKPAAGKTVDPDPIYVNCDAETVWMD
jgi:hypothetical protein